MKKTKFFTLFFLLASFSLPGADLSEDIYDRDIRSICRSEVAGLLLNAISELEMAKEYIRISGEKAKDLQPVLKKNVAEWKKARAENSRDYYDYEKQMEVDGAYYAMTLVKEQIAENLKVRDHHQGRLKQLEIWRWEVEKRIKKVFQVTRVDLPQHNGRSHNVEYRHKCKDYHYLCPLPRKDAVNLVKIYEGTTVLEGCKRYSQIQERRF